MHNMLHLLTAALLRHRIAVLLAAVALVLLWPGETSAQIRDSRGKEFWVTFLPNYHNAPDDREDSLYIYITTEQAASGSIEYFDIRGQRYERSFSLNAGEFYIFSTVFTDFELEGMTSPSGFNSNPQNELPAPQAFHITSNTEVTVYGLNQARTTSDAFIALPVDVLGTDYYVVSYPSDGNPNYTPSEFAVLATEDGTDVTITPSVATSSGSAQQQQVRLNRGQAYLVQTQFNSTLDLTGSRVSSTKPIAVFAGHQRARVSQSPSSQSRDHLVEQLPPIPAWGGSAFVTPYPLANNAEPSNVDKYRVLAAFNNTDIYVDGVFLRTLSAGQYYDTVLSKSEWLTATGPILVTQYKKTSQRVGGGGNNYTGDPFMIVNSPVEQYLKRYQCFSVMAWEDDPDIYGNEQYMTIIAPTDSIGTVRLNGVPIPAARFRPLSITSYSYTDSLRVRTGINVVEANVGVGVYVYGYGFANSYGYIGGMKYDSIYTFDPPDIIPPLILGTPVCDSLTGGVYDTLAFDRGIRSVTVDDQTNSVVTVDSLVAPARSTGFRAWLTDPYRDGSFTISTRDSAGAGRTRTFSIPGYTVRMSTATDGTPPTSTATLRIGTTTCATIILTNDGGFPQTISTADFAGEEFSVTTPLPVTIPPGGTRTLRVCFTSNAAAALVDTLVIGNACARRAVAVFNVKVEAPLQSSTALQCEQLRGMFYDTAAVKLRVERVETLPDSTVNAIVQIDPFAPGADSISFQARLVDPYEDGRGSVVAYNNTGIQGWVNFAIPGFTIHADPVTRTPVRIDDETRTGKTLCLPVELTNYGRFDRVVSSLRMKNSSPEFTFQPSSVTVPAGGKAVIQVCFLSNDLGSYADSLIIGDECTERTVAFVAISALKDTLRPVISRLADSCRTVEYITIADNLRLDWGLASVSVTETINCTVDIDSSAMPGALSLEVRPVDRREDASYRIVAVDSAGNMRDTTFILQGFTLRFTTAQAGTYSFGVADAVRCDSVPVFNASTLPFVLEGIDLFDNVHFSTPLSQFPLTIPPRDTGYVLLCFEPARTATGDTMSIRQFCFEEKIALAGSYEQFLFSTATGCNVEIRLSSTRRPTTAFVQQNFPNPSADATTLVFGVDRELPVRITLYNALGNRVAVLVDDVLGAGQYDISVDLTGLENGVYFYEFTAGAYRSIKSMNIIR